MSDPPSDEDENTVDIFVLSKGEKEPLLQNEILKKKGYHITLFTDSTQIQDSLRHGRPNLLICDTVSLPQEAYDVCRQIKADDRHWMIPVLVVTAASSLSDLLNVLDCNADNFIAHPFDPPYLISLIEGMLSTPVERTMPEQIKTQFRIQHDDKVYVVTADRRKLLEFLLSSFEIAVNISGNLSRAREEIAEITRSLRHYESVVGEQARVIETVNAALLKKDQTLRELEEKLSDREHNVSRLSDANEQLSRELEGSKALLATAEERILQMARENDATAEVHRSEIDGLNRQVSSLSEALASTKTELEKAVRALEEKTTQCEATVQDLDEITAHREQAEKSLRALTLEHEQMKVSLAAEKNRAQAAAEEVREVLQAKTDSEQDLTRIINELRDTAKEQAQTLVRNTGELESAKNQITALERDLNTIRTEKEKTESALRDRADSISQELCDLRVKYGMTVAQFEEKERRIPPLELELNQTRVERDRIGADLQALTRELEAARAALAEEKEEHRSAEERLTSMVGERDAALRTLRAAHDELKTDLDSHKNGLVQAKGEIQSASELRETLECRLEAGATRIRELESEVRTLSSDHAQAAQQVRTLSDELEQVKAALGNERRLHHATDEKLVVVSQVREQFLHDLRKSAEELALLKHELEEERTLRQAMEAQKHSAEVEQEQFARNISLTENERSAADEERTASIRNLTSDLESALARQRVLEDQVTGLTKEKQLIEEKASGLSEEIDQARTALADEWEDHMNDQERLVVATEKKVRLEEELHRAEEPEAEQTKKRAVIIREQGLPVEVRAVSKALSLSLPSQTPGSPPPRITGVEDLFEEDEPQEKETDPLPAVTIVSEPSAGFEDENLPKDIQEDPGSAEPEPEEGKSPDGEVERREEEAGIEEISGTPGEIPGPANQSGIAFNRAQWLDLLKWAHHSGALSQEQRMQIVRMGRLIQKGRKLTRRQDEQVREMMVLVQTLGYHLT